MAEPKVMVGNIETSSSLQIELQEGKISVSDLGSMTFTDRLVLISPPQWIANNVDYDYTTLNRQRLRKVKTYKAQFEITFPFMDRQTYLDLMDLLNLMDGYNNIFTSSGVRTFRKFYMKVSGDLFAPTLEVVKISEPKTNTKYINDRLIGYDSFSFVVETVQEFDRMHLPKEYPIHTSTYLGGFMSTSTACYDVRIL